MSYMGVYDIEVSYGGKCRVSPVILKGGVDRIKRATH